MSGENLKQTSESLNATQGVAAQEDRPPFYYICNQGGEGALSSQLKEIEKPTFHLFRWISNQNVECTRVPDVRSAAAAAANANSVVVIVSDSFKKAEHPLMKPPSVSNPPWPLGLPDGAADDIAAAIHDKLMKK